MLEGFMLDLDTAIKFYEICQQLGLETLEERKGLMRILVKEKKAKYVRDVDALLKDKKVLDLRRKHE